ncbi:MAG: hypothetical protein Q8L14_05825 [Myxococcales bacterium]|nr:hypothetical protein [Myxococcales bacterium]
MVLLTKAEVEERLRLAKEQPTSTYAMETPELLRRWLVEPGLQMAPEVRAMIEAALRPGR